jgi:NAD(P)-dependent dehydrogenase (short-subunit alcohol dehydrogenase family)
MTIGLSAWDQLLRTNLTASLLAARAVLPLMARSKIARIVFLTSEAGWANTAGVAPYNISKAALNSLGMCLAADAGASFVDTDVQINLLNPGEARTEMNQGSGASPFSAVPMTLLLLSHPDGGPNGHFFHRDGRHLSFGYSEPFQRSLA